MTNHTTTLVEGLDEIARLPQGIGLIRQSILKSAISGRMTLNARGRDISLDKIGFSHPAAGGRRENLLFSLPNDWDWIRLDKVSASVLGKMLDRDKNRGELRPYLRNTNVRWHEFDLTDLKQMRFEDDEEIRYGLRRGDVVVCEGGEPGRAAVWDSSETALIQKALHRVRCGPSLNPYWLTCVLDSFAREGILSEYFTGIGIKHLTGASLKRIMIPLPPRPEQDRLVRQVRNLLSKADELEIRLIETERHRSALVSRAFDLLGSGLSDQALGMLDELVHNQGDVNKFERAVIELAVRGRLVPQAPTPLSVDSLLQSVGHKTLDDAQFSQVLEEPYAAPEGWRWVHLGAVLTKIQAGWSPSAQPRPKEGEEWGVLKVSACSWGEFRPHENKALQSDQLPRSDLEVRSGDFLISRANTSELVARSVVVDMTPPQLMLSDKTLRLSVVDGCNPEYLNLANLAQAARSHYETEATGTSSSMKNVSQKVIRRTPIPLPPPAEQDQIVAVVSELVALLRKLNLKLAG